MKFSREWSRTGKEALKGSEITQSFRGSLWPQHVEKLWRPRRTHLKDVLSRAQGAGVFMFLHLTFVGFTPGEKNLRYFQILTVDCANRWKPMNKASHKIRWYVFLFLFRNYMSRTLQYANLHKFGLQCESLFFANINIPKVKTLMVFWLLFSNITLY